MCRTANGFDVNGFGQLKDGRGNICPVTIIMPTIAMEAKEQADNNVVEEFLTLLDKRFTKQKICCLSDLSGYVHKVQIVQNLCMKIM